MEKLLFMLLKRLEREDQLTPKYIGIFDSLQSMPAGNYPAIFFWVNRSQKNAIQISVNTPLAERLLTEECKATGTKPSEMDRLATIEVFAKVAMKDAEPAVGAIIDKAGGLANLTPVEI
jgi:hypothetical protein